MSFRLQEKAARIKPTLGEPTLARVLEACEDLKRRRVYPSLFNLQKYLQGELPYAVTYTARGILLETHRLELPSANAYRKQPNAISPATLRKRHQERAQREEVARTPHYVAQLGPCWRAIREYRQSRWNRPFEWRTST